MAGLCDESYTAKYAVEGETRPLHSTWSHLHLNLILSRHLKVSLTLRDYNELGAQYEGTSIAVGLHLHARFAAQ